MARLRASMVNKQVFEVQERDSRQIFRRRTSKISVCVGGVVVSGVVWPLVNSRPLETCRLSLTAADALMQEPVSTENPELPQL